MAIEPKKINYDVAIKSTNHTRSYSLPPEVYTSDTAVQFRFNILDVEAAEFTEGAAVSTVEITTRDGSFFQHVGETSLEGTTVIYDLKEAEGNHAGLAKIQLKINLGGEYFTSDEYEFKILNSIATGVPVEIYVQNWETLTAQANAYLTKMAADIEDFDVALETGVLATNIAAKLIELQTTYAPRLLSVEQQLEQKADKGNVSVGDININLGKFDQTYMTDEFIQQMAGTTAINAVISPLGVTSDKLAPKSVTPEKMSFITKSSNLFDKSSVTLNKSIDLSTGIPVDNATNSLSDFIAVNPNSACNDYRTIRRAYYNSDKAFVSTTVGDQNGGVGAFITGSNVYYVRLVIPNRFLNTAQLNLGSEKLPYENFYEYLSDDKFFKDGVITSYKLSNMNKKRIINGTPIDFDFTNRLIKFNGVGIVHGETDITINQNLDITS